MKKNQHSDRIVTLWYIPDSKIRKMVGVPFKSKSRYFDFEIIDDKHGVYSGKHRIVRLNRKNVLFFCPKNIRHYRKQQFMSLFYVLKIGKIKSAFPSETISELEKHIDELPGPLKTFVANSFNGVKNLDPNLDPEYMSILKRWVEYVFSKRPKRCKPDK